VRVQPYCLHTNPPDSVQPRKITFRMPHTEECGMTVAAWKIGGGKIYLAQALVSGEHVVVGFSPRSPVWSSAG
jgi:hypothetical protein